MKKLIMLYFFLAGGIAANTKNIDYTSKYMTKI